jgi:hypothetical protein
LAPSCYGRGDGLASVDGCLLAVSRRGSGRLAAPACRFGRRPAAPLRVAPAVMVQHACCRCRAFV